MKLLFAMFTEVEMRSTIRVLTTCGKTGKEILQEVNVLYDAGCMSKKLVYEWWNMFLHNHTNLADEEQSGRPSDSTFAFKNVQQIVSFCFQEFTTISSSHRVSTIVCCASETMFLSRVNTG